MFVTIFSEDIVVYCLRVVTLSCFLAKFVGYIKERSSKRSKCFMMMVFNGSME